MRKGGPEMTGAGHAQHSKEATIACGLQRFQGLLVPFHSLGLTGDSTCRPVSALFRPLSDAHALILSQFWFWFQVVFFSAVKPHDAIFGSVPGHSKRSTTSTDCTSILNIWQINEEMEYSTVYNLSGMSTFQNHSKYEQTLPNDLEMSLFQVPKLDKINTNPQRTIEQTRGMNKQWERAALVVTVGPIETCTKWAPGVRTRPTLAFPFHYFLLPLTWVWYDT